MEIFILLALGAVIYLVAFPIYLAIKIENLSHEIQRLKTGSSLQSQPRQVQQTTNPVVQNVERAQSEAMSQQPVGAPQTVYAPSAESAFILWLKKDFFVKLGAFLLLIGFGWFVSYAFANNWIGPIGRITLGLVVGVGIMGLGVWRIRTQLHQGAIFTVLGSGVVLLTIYAAREIYGFFTPATALGIMFLSIVFVAFMSVQYKSENLALAGLVLAAVAPFLTNAPEPSMFGLLSYLMIVVLGTLWVVYSTGSNSLTFAALLIVVFYSIPSAFGYLTREDELIGLLFAFAFTAIFFVSNIMSITFKQTDAAKIGHVATAVVTGLFLIAWIAFAASEEWQSLLYIAWMLVFSAGAFAVYIRTRHRVPFYIYSAVGIGLLAAATAAELGGALLIIVYTIEVGVLVTLASALISDQDIAKKVSFLFLGPIFMSFEHMDWSYWVGVIHEDFFVLLILTSALLGVGTFMYGKRAEGVRDTVDTAAVLVVGGMVYALTLIWLVLHTLLVDDTATMFSLVIYTIVGLMFYIRGQHEESSHMKTAGGILLGLVVARLLLVDVWQMELAGRIITFFATGVLLISTAFLGKKKDTDVDQQIQ